MPLSHGKSKKAFEHNIKTEMEHGKPMKQSLAIAYSMKRKAAHKKAHGGEIHHEELESGYLPEPKEHEIHNAAALHEDEKDINEHLGPDSHDLESHPLMAHGGDIVAKIMHKRKMMAHGGVVADEGEGDLEEMVDHDKNDFDYLSMGDLDDSTSNSGEADGDYDGDAREDHDRHDIVAKIMKARAKQHNPRPA